MIAGRGWRVLIAFLAVAGQPHLVLAEPATPEPAGAPFVSSVASQNPSAHLTYASILFYKGLGLLQAGKPDEGKAVFQTVEAELRLAMRLSEPTRAEPDVKLLRSQCAFLLGELTLNVFQAPASAQAFYEQALREYPEHDGASRALARLLFADAEAHRQTDAKPTPPSR